MPAPQRNRSAEERVVVNQNSPIRLSKNAFNRLKKGPTPADCTGHVYVWCFKDKPNEVKVGRTQGTADTGAADSKRWTRCVSSYGRKISDQMVLLLINSPNHKGLESTIHVQLADIFERFKYDPLNKPDGYTEWFRGGNFLNEMLPHINMVVHVWKHFYSGQSPRGSLQSIYICSSEELGPPSEIASQLEPYRCQALTKSSSYKIQCSRSNTTPKASGGFCFQHIGTSHCVDSKSTMTPFEQAAMRSPDAVNRSVSHSASGSNATVKAKVKVEVKEEVKQESRYVTVSEPANASTLPRRTLQLPLPPTPERSRRTATTTRIKSEKKHILTK